MCVKKMQFIIKFVLLVTIAWRIVRGQQDTCYTSSRGKGQCIVLDNCLELQSLIQKSRESLAEFHCGWERNIPKVCCPLAGFVTDNVPKGSCVTSEGNGGSCISLSSCPYITNMLKTQNPQSLEYYQQARNLCPDGTSVCCDLKIDPTSEVISRDNTCPPSAIPPDPKSQCCGIESFSGNKIINGKEAAIDQYPWLALIEYSSRPQLCGGSLISNQYVLTAAHCILNKSNKPRGATSVLLGEYNTTNSGRDCVKVEGDGEDCTLGAERIPIESAISHPNYNKEPVVQYAHDIALLRLAKIITFNDFIRPICLPTSDITKTSKTDTMRFFVAGWGAVNETRPRSDVKLYTSLPFVNHQKCQLLFNTNKGSLIWDSQICAGGEPNKDTCKGDSGGPLMYENDKIQEVVGVISFGLLQCGLKVPSIYTKVYDYLSWINETIKP